MTLTAISQSLLAPRGKLPRQFSHEKAQKPSVLPTEDFRALIGALQAAFALRLFAPFCGHDLYLFGALNLGFFALHPAENLAG
ncbi:MAG: hypothetical protein HY736_18755 [Verrucomicrobia bacterium]|nr:hypothetical protein [Verrucomicrobiota bacterium]